eukprot:3782161-Pyramimonas_sp.AAC.1
MPQGTGERRTTVSDESCCGSNPTGNEGEHWETLKHEEDVVDVDVCDDDDDENDDYGGDDDDG